MYYLVIFNFSEVNIWYFIGIVILFYFFFEKLIINFYIDKDKNVCINVEFEYI